MTREALQYCLLPMRVYLFQNIFVPKKTAFAVFFCRVGELYFQVQHLKKKEKVHIDLWYNRLSKKTHIKEKYVNYNHLTIEERCCIRESYKKGKSFC